MRDDVLECPALQCTRVFLDSLSSFLMSASSPNLIQDKPRRAKGVGRSS